MPQRPAPGQPWSPLADGRRQAGEQTLAQQRTVLQARLDDGVISARGATVAVNSHVPDTSNFTAEAISGRPLHKQNFRRMITVGASLVAMAACDDYGTDPVPAPVTPAVRKERP